MTTKYLRKKIKEEALESGGYYAVMPYSYWLKVAVLCCVPSTWDWKNVCSTFWEFFKTLLDACLRLLVRALMIVTFPVSIPLIALGLHLRDKRVVKERITERDRLQEDMQRLNQK